MAVDVTLPKLGDDDEILSSDAIAFLRMALSSPMAPWAQYLSVSLPVSPEAPEKFLRLVPRSMGYLWRSPSGHQFAGGGAAAIVAVRGVDRFTRAPQLIGEICTSVERRAFEKAPPRTVFVGGAAFAPDVPAIEPWDEFTEDAFVLPRWGYRRQGGAAAITLTVTREELSRPGAVDAVIDETKTLTRALDYETATSLIERIDIPRSAVHHMSEQDWRAYIAAIHEAIASGAYQKIVAARRCVVELHRMLEDTGFMARVFASYPDCTHFAIRRDTATFLGATPETLFRKDGSKLTTHALAGTLRVKDDPSMDASKQMAALRSSQKDQAEHAMVAQRICQELWPLSKRIRYASAPETRRVRNLIHLQTPISAELRAETTVFDLLSALHPTPAVGGFPAREAADWIRLNEPQERGWYTGTIGWIDSEGDGEFAVAIRCGVLTARRAYIYAGAGIIDASDAGAEYAETAGKMTPVLRALGVAS